MAVTVNVAVWPAVTLWAAGAAAIEAGTQIPRTATAEFTAPQPLVITQRNWAPLSPDATVNVYAAAVAVAPIAFVHVVPFGLLCHWYEGVVTSGGTTTANVALSAAILVCEAGCWVMDGGVHTVSRAADEYTMVPHPVETDTRYCQALLAVAVVNVYDGAVPPVAALVHVLPVSALYCHWYDTRGVPVAVTVNVAGRPAVVLCGAG